MTTTPITVRFSYRWDTWPSPCVIAVPVDPGWYETPTPLIVAGDVIGTPRIPGSRSEWTDAQRINDLLADMAEERDPRWLVEIDVDGVVLYEGDGSDALEVITRGAAAALRAVVNP